MTNNEGFVNLDVEAPDSNSARQQPTRDVKPEFGRKPDIVLDPAAVKSPMTPQEVMQAVDSTLQGEGVDEKDTNKDDKKE